MPFAAAGMALLFNISSTFDNFLDEEKNGYAARDQLLYAL